jgi:subtilisin-like proprotein convertase family protein
MKKAIYIICIFTTWAFLFTGIASAQTQLIVDGGFETGPGGTAWSQSSTNFGTPLCDLNTCGNGSGTGPRNGTYWAWFGGLPGGTESASISQTIIIPAGATTSLSFWIEQIICDSPQDFLEVRIDGNSVFTTTGANNLCGVLGYSQQVINISSYADGLPHDIEFFSTTFSVNGGSTNFFIDDVSVLATVGTGGCPNIAIDGGFEAGPTGPAWTQASTNFGTPLCNLAGCGNGGGTGPRSGSFWSWFGGFPGGIETGSVSQTITFPSGNNITLKFYLEIPQCDGPQDFLEVRVDGQQVFQTTGANPACGTTGYALQTVNLSSFADGNPHLIEFNSTTFAANGNATNFFVDDITIESCPPSPGACNDTTSFNGLNVAIPDGNAAGVTNSQTITGVSGNTLGVDAKLASVCFTIAHSWVGDLIVRLTSPSGNTITLMDRPGVPALLSGCDGDDVDVCIDLGLGNELENVCGTTAPSIAGSFTAANGTNLNSINAGGGSPNGTWQLFVSDNAGFDTGVITSWKLVFDDGPVASWNAPASICANSPAVNLNSLVVGTTGGTWSGPGVSGNIFNPTGLSGSVSVTYSVSSGGCSDAQTNSIFVFANSPAASFTFNTVGLTTYFTNTSTGASTYSWNFGDGNSSTNPSPTHTYAAAGFYTVTLTITSPCGTNTTSQLVGVVACGEKSTDGGFENGPGSGSWTEASTNFGTPLCDLSGCGNGGGTGPRTGTYWSWFGGIATFEESSVEQSFGPVAANNDLTLYFWLEQSECDGPDDFLKVVIDSDTVFATTGASTICGQVGYSLQTVNLNAYADGQAHTLKFFSRVYGTNGGVTNFFVDDISLLACIGTGLDDSDFGNDIAIFPTPASDILHIDFGKSPKKNVSLSFIDMLGKTILQSSYESLPSDSKKSFDISNLGKGIYSVIISSEGNSIVRKIVVQ